MCACVYSLVSDIHICHTCDKQERERQREMTQNREGESRFALERQASLQAVVTEAPAPGRSLTLLSSALKQAGSGWLTTHSLCVWRSHGGSSKHTLPDFKDPFYLFVPISLFM